jgi:sialidase-1
LSAAISKDEGKTWSEPLTLFDEPDGWYCYTAIHFEGDYVLLAHCAGGPGQGGSGLSVTQVSRLPLSAFDE